VIKEIKVYQEIMESQETKEFQEHLESRGVSHQGTVYIALTNRNYSTILATLQITSYALGV
jgi:hypothetical protein